jgi:hypothetical protein
MKTSNEPIVNRTRDLPACSTVLQPTVLQHKQNKHVGYVESNERELLLDIVLFLILYIPND